MEKVKMAIACRTAVRIVDEGMVVFCAEICTEGEGAREVRGLVVWEESA